MHSYTEGFFIDFHIMTFLTRAVVGLGRKNFCSKWVAICLDGSSELGL